MDVYGLILPSRLQKLDKLISHEQPPDLQHHPSSSQTLGADAHEQPNATSQMLVARGERCRWNAYGGNFPRWTL